MKYIAPGSWFSLEYPESWREFEDTEDSFLFYNPNKWSGNFRISAYQGGNDRYASECIAYELKQVKGAHLVKVGNWECAYSTDNFQENGSWYTTQFMGYRERCYFCRMFFYCCQGRKLEAGRGDYPFFVGEG